MVLRRFQCSSWSVTWRSTRAGDPTSSCLASKGFPALARLAPDMNSLVAVGTAAAFGYSLVAT
ncbi:hypothetical protein V5H41_26235, partial [Salmonella enterica]